MTASDQTPLDLSEALCWPRECTEGVTRKGEFQSCDLPAVAVRIDPACGEPYPVCARHTRALMVTLPDLIAAVRAQAAAEIEAERDRLYPGTLPAYRVIRAVIDYDVRIARGADA